MDKGYIHVYTGEGKGKTTAALGLALRGICANKSVCIIQFMKGVYYSELKAQELLPHLKIEQFGKNSLVHESPDEEDYSLAKKGLSRLEEVLLSKDFDIVIADELNIALAFHLLKTSEVLPVIHQKRPEIELIITGRYAPREIIDIADLVTVMAEVKHYYHEGVKAREGIEK